MGNRFKSIDLGLILIITLGLFINVTSANALPIQNKNIYLPIIIKEYPPAPVLFPNGDFEQGPLIWTESSTNGWELIVKEFPYGFNAYEGTWATWLGGDFPEISYIEQQITVPTNLHHLTFWYWIDSEDACGNDFGRVLANSNEVHVYDLCQANNTNGWVQEVIDLSAYAGQSVIIQIRAECNTTPFCNLFIDHVGFQYSSNITNYPPENITIVNDKTLKLDSPGK